MSLKHQLIELLADGQFHSGEALGKKLQVCRSAIWKTMHQLAEAGITINSLKSKGYQIQKRLELLDLESIENYLSPHVTENISIKIFKEIPSTSQYLLEHPDTPSKTVILAEQQTQGRGRRQRHWYSPYGCNIYFSILWSFEKDPSELTGLSLVMGIAVANTLEKYGIHPVQLKWPNDVLYQNKKLAGILIEITAETHSSTQTIIGIGINLDMPENTQIDQDWSDVATITKQRPARNKIVAYLIEEVFQLLLLFEQKGFTHFFKHWQALDAYYQKPVIVKTPKQDFIGVGNGINKQGEFCLLQDDETEMRFLHGEVSLRPL